MSSFALCVFKCVPIIAQNLQGLWDHLDKECVCNSCIFLSVH